MKHSLILTEAVNAESENGTIVSRPFSRFAKRTKTVEESRVPSASTYQVLSLAVSMLDVFDLLRSFGPVCRDTKQISSDYLRCLRSITFDGRDARVRSAGHLVDWMSQNLDLSRIEILCIRNVQVDASYGTFEDNYELESADNRSNTTSFPLGIIAQMKSLKKLVVESSRLVSRRNVVSLPEPSVKSLPLQLGLANLHEISNSCPLMETLSCAHVDVDEPTGMVLDTWGPDCTPQALRDLHARCPRLQHLGVLSSPGPRMLREMRRMGAGSQTQEITDIPEIQEAFRVPLAFELTRFSPGPITVVLALSGPALPHASARTRVLGYQRAYRRTDDVQIFLGEYQDVLDNVSDFPSTLRLGIIARKAQRKRSIEHTRRMNDFEEEEVAQLERGLVHHHHVTLMRVPWMSSLDCQANLCPDIRSWTQTVSTFDEQFKGRKSAFASVSRSGSFAVNVRSEPHNPFLRSDTLVSEEDLENMPLVSHPLHLSVRPYPVIPPRSFGHVAQSHVVNQGDGHEPEDEAGAVHSMGLARSFTEDEDDFDVFADGQREV